MAESWCVLEAKQQRINGIHTNKGSHKGKFRRSIPNRNKQDENYCHQLDRHRLEWNVILKGWGNAISEKLTGTFIIKIIFEGLYVQQKMYLSKFPSFALVDFNHVSLSTSTIAKPFYHTVSKRLLHWCTTILCLSCDTLWLFDITGHPYTTLSFHWPIQTEQPNDTISSANMPVNMIKPFT
jgi:hypothetical protein